MTEEPAISAIIFDLDGTLVDSYPGLLESLNETLRALGRHPVDPGRIRTMVGRGVESLIRQAVGDEDVQQGLHLFRAAYDRHHLSGTTLMPGVAATLKTLDDLKVKMAVASNKPSHYSRGILRNLDIDRYMALCFGPDSVSGLTKPDPAMVRTVLKKLQVESDRALYVGDMLLDSETARNAGVRLALVAGGGNSVEELNDAHPDYLLASFSSLLELF
jgi:phosphoglycolate phosphatase